VTATVSIWRIATDAPTYEATDLSGTGAKLSGGRWNRPGTPLVYASSSIALACLETLSHLDSGDLPLNRYLVRIQVPAAIWNKAMQLEPSVGWDATPAGKVSLDAGTKWVAGRQSVLLKVPSAIVAEEANILINSEHPDATRLKAAKVRKFLYDSRLLNL
jgi:RES domain-containing protein